MTNECDNLEAYLADDLPADAATRFAGHLDQCAACRYAVDEQRWIDQVLFSTEFAIVEPVPAVLQETFRISIARRRQKTRLIACGLATAAATLVVALGWAVMPDRQAMNIPWQTPNQIANTATSNTSESDPAAPRRATFVSNGDTIAVPLESTDDNVTIVQLYPTTETERRPRRELHLQFNDTKLHGGGT